jgi:protein-tyrosine phosphatase
VLYARHVPRAFLPLLHVWFVLVGISVLTTYQHHFIDIPTGALLGFFALWLWPDDAASPILAARLAHDRKRRTLAVRYLVGSFALAMAAIALGGAGLVLLWPAVSLLLVAASYAALGAEGFQKRADGSMSLAARAILAPYLVAAFVNSRLWTRTDPRAVEIAERVYLGRIPSRRDLAAGAIATVVDLSAELPHRARFPAYHALPMLDLVAPPPEKLRKAAQLIELRRPAGPVLVCCALGYSRSAAAVAAWLLATGRASDADAAIASIRRARPRIVLDETARAAVVAAQSNDQHPSQSRPHAGGGSGSP